MIETVYSNPNALAHYGVPGMRWGHRKAYDSVGTGLTIRRNQNGQSYVSPLRTSNNTRVRRGGGGTIKPQVKKSVGFEACSNLIVKHKLTSVGAVKNSKSTAKGESTFDSWTDMVKV